MDIAHITKLQEIVSSMLTIAHENANTFEERKDEAREKIEALKQCRNNAVADFSNAADDRRTAVKSRAQEKIKQIALEEREAITVINQEEKLGLDWVKGVCTPLIKVAESEFEQISADHQALLVPETPKAAASEMIGHNKPPVAESVNGNGKVAA